MAQARLVERVQDRTTCDADVALPHGQAIRGRPFQQAERLL